MRACVSLLHIYYKCLIYVLHIYVIMLCLFIMHVMYVLCI